MHCSFLCNHKAEQRPFGKKPASTQRRSRTGKKPQRPSPSPLADVLTALITSGHSPNMVLDDYTIDEIMAYYRAIIRKKTADTRFHASMIRTATQGSQKNYRAYIRALDNAQRKMDTMATGGDVRAVASILDNAVGVSNGGNRRRAPDIDKD